MPNLRVISLGWGVQSFALACMSALGVLPKVDAAIHADTGWEREGTYRLAKKWTPWLEGHGVSIVTVQAKHSMRLDFQDVEAHRKMYSPPFFVKGPKGAGQLGRHCTGNWKRDPVQRATSELLSSLGMSKTPDAVEMWLGITLDEIERMRLHSRTRYITNHFPFIQDFEPPRTRRDVANWLVTNNFDIPVKSSCTFCPYRDRNTWHEIQLENGHDWQQAVKIDTKVRHMKNDFLCYISRQRKPLEDCDFRSPEDLGQLTLWEAEECSGMCFL